MNSLNGISNKIDKALDLLYEKDAYLICFDDKFHVSERSITHKLGCYLSPLFESYDVDCEYNRFIYEGKFVEKLKQNVIPDIIIHKRGECNNFIAIEVKTWWNKSKVSDDKDKLIELTKSKYNYKYGISLIINKNRDEVIKSIFENGKEV